MVMAQPALSAGMVDRVDTFEGVLRRLGVRQMPVAAAAETIEIAAAAEAIEVEATDEGSEEEQVGRNHRARGRWLALHRGGAVTGDAG